VAPEHLTGFAPHVGPDLGSPRHASSFSKQRGRLSENIFTGSSLQTHRRLYVRGKDEQQLDVFSYVSAERRVPQEHPCVPCATTDEALRQLKARFANLYANIGRPSISPEKLLRAKSVEP
jgi:hypothetical protein